MKLEIREGFKRYPGVILFENINIKIQKGSFVSLVGKSGIGKTTLLRIFAGLEKLDSGSIFMNDSEINKTDSRRIVVFQNFDQLFPWFTVLENILFPMKVNKEMNTEEFKKRALNLIERVGLKGFENAYPNTLSGGMKQRTAIARALLSKPEVLLLDEPFSSLDALTRSNLQNLTLELWAEHDLTAFLVTHDVNEAILLSDKILCMGKDKITEFTVEKERPRHLSDVENSILANQVSNAIIA